MSVRNKMAKGAFYVLLTFYMIIQSYGIGILIDSVLLSPVLAIWTIIKPLPLFLTQKLWLIWILSAVPFGVAVYIYMLVNLVKANSKNRNKQDNGNQ